MTVNVAPPQKLSRLLHWYDVDAKCNANLLYGSEVIGEGTTRV